MELVCKFECVDVYVNSKKVGKEIRKRPLLALSTRDSRKIGITEA